MASFYWEKYLKKKLVRSLLKQFEESIHLRYYENNSIHKIGAPGFLNKVLY